jgi:mono/diheme cytochrome c family protein
MKKILIAAIAALAVPAAALYAQGGGRGPAPLGHTPAPTSPVTGNAASGKALYYSYACYACHGYNGETGARVFVGNWGNLATEERFIGFLRGRANVAPIVPSTSMPNFGETALSDKQAKDIYAYIRSFKSTAVEAKDAAALNAILAAAKQEKK